MLQDVTTAVELSAVERARIHEALEALRIRRVDLETPRACVLVPLCHVRGRPSVLFTKRSESVGTHKGQVSFPGGRMDPSDVDERACALRELEEEVGISAPSVEVLGFFHEAMAITGVRVSPVIGYLGELGDLSGLVLERAEIDVAFTLTLDELARHREVRPLGLRRAPYFTAGPHPVWGLTALILDEVLRELLGMDLPLVE